MQNLTDQNKISHTRTHTEAKQGANMPERINAGPVWLPVCAFTGNHFMVHFQDSFSSNLKKFVCVFFLIFLAMERVSANRCGCGVSLLPAWFSLSEWFFTDTQFLRGKESEFKGLENPWNK